MAENGAPGLPVPASHATVVAKRAGLPARRGLDRLPVYVTAEEARAIINATRGFRDRLLLETIWQTGGRISEVLRLRPADVDPADGTIRLANLKQRRGAEKVVYVSLDLAAQLRALARDLRVPLNGYLFQGRNPGRPMTRFQAYRIISAAARAAGVLKVHPESGRVMPAWPHTFRHGAAKHQLEQTLRLDFVQDQLGHASLETTKVYLRLADADRRRLRDQISY
ncbi:MAG: tyrosine-type recombinase/integrase [Sphingomonadaceae bacterium]